MPKLQHFLDPRPLFGLRLANDRAAQKPQNANRKSQQHSAPRKTVMAPLLTDTLAVQKPTLRERAAAPVAQPRMNGSIRQNVPRSVPHIQHELNNAAVSE